MNALDVVFARAADNLGIAAQNADVVVIVVFVAYCHDICMHGRYFITVGRIARIGQNGAAVAVRQKKAGMSIPFNFHKSVNSPSNYCTKVIFALLSSIAAAEACTPPNFPPSEFPKAASTARSAE